MADLEGKVALITGASRGIGRACALEMARAGASIAVNYRSHPDEAAEVVRAVQAMGGQAVAIGCDVADRQAVDVMTAQTVAELGRLDIAVANAYYSKRQPFLELDEEGVRRTLDVTLLGAFFTAQSAARHMVERGEGGALLFISSVLARSAFATSLPYCAAKAGMNHMCRVVAQEMAPHKIRANAIEPGYTDTPGERQFATDEQIEAAAQSLPWKRLATGQDIARAATFLCSPAADYITGSVLTVDGGFTLRN